MEALGSIWRQHLEVGLVLLYLVEKHGLLALGVQVEHVDVGVVDGYEQRRRLADVLAAQQAERGALVQVDLTQVASAEAADEQARAVEDPLDASRLGAGARTSLGLQDGLVAGKRRVDANRAVLANRGQLGAARTPAHAEYDIGVSDEAEHGLLSRDVPQLDSSVVAGRGEQVLGIRMVLDAVEALDVTLEFGARLLHGRLEAVGAYLPDAHHAVVAAHRQTLIIERIPLEVGYLRLVHQAVDVCVWQATRLVDLLLLLLLLINS